MVLLRRFLRHIKEGFLVVKRHFAMAISSASAVTITLLLVGVFTVFAFNLGYLTKEIGNDNNTYYQYINKCEEENHFYLKCISCGQLIHVDCSFVEELSNHIISHHKFKLSKDHIIINGLCEECQRGEQ